MFLPHSLESGYLARNEELPAAVLFESGDGKNQLPATIKTISNTSRIARILLVVACFARGALAMTPGPTIIRECPGCAKPLTQFTIGSGNTYAAKWWTDGKVDAPMLRKGRELSKCPDCQKLFWIADAKQLAELSFFGEKATNAKWAQAKAIQSPVEEDYLTVARAAGLSREHELFAREQAWWLANDANRGRTDGIFTWSGARLENLQKLSALLNEKVDYEVVLKAEIARELGQFETCLNLLARPFRANECECELYAAFIRKLAGEQKSKVEMLPPVENQKRDDSAKPPQNSKLPTTANTYSIHAGDTLGKIARQNHVTVKALAEANPGINPTKLQIGQTLKLPAR